MLRQILGTAEVASAINGLALETPARMGRQYMLAEIPFVGIALIASLLCTCEARLRILVLGLDVLLQVAGLAVASAAMLAPMPILAVQRVLAMLGVQRPLFEGQWARRTGVELAAALVALALPLLIEAPGTLCAAKRIILRVLPDLVAFQLQFLRELGVAVAARIDTRTLVGLAQMALHIAVGDEHLVTLIQQALDRFLGRRLRSFVGAPQVTLQMRHNGVGLVAALMGAGVFLLQRKALIHNSSILLGTAYNSRMVIFVAVQLVQTLKRRLTFSNAAGVFRIAAAIATLLKMLELLQDIVQVAITSYLRSRRHFYWTFSAIYIKNHFLAGAIENRLKSDIDNSCLQSVTVHPVGSSRLSSGILWIPTENRLFY